MSQNKYKALSSKRRLAQIVSILRKHHLAKGINPVKFRMILEDLGPTFVKIGQIMASRQDMFSQRYCQELVKLRDNVAPMDIQSVREVIEEEYGTRLENVFSQFADIPLGSASIAQVHQAILKDGRHIGIQLKKKWTFLMKQRSLNVFNI